jgi:hypothetical protein
MNYAQPLIITQCLIFFFMTGCTDLYLASQGRPSVFNGYTARQRGAGLWDVNLPNGDVNAEVGHPFSAYVRGSCETATTREPWVFDLIYSGTLPPGLSLTRDPTGIIGIPTARGHYIVHLTVLNSKCNGENFQDHEAELRIHVTGTGQVIQ